MSVFSRLLARGDQQASPQDRQDATVLRTVGYLTGSRSLTVTNHGEPLPFKPSAKALMAEIQTTLRGIKGAEPLAPEARSLLQETHKALSAASRPVLGGGVKAFTAFAAEKREQAREVLGAGPGQGYIARYERDQLGAKAETEMAGLIINGPLHRRMT